MATVHPLTPMSRRITIGAAALLYGLLWSSPGLAESASRSVPVPVTCTPGAPSLCVIADSTETDVLIALTVPAGSAAERLGEGGVAHYLEHLTFRNRSVKNGEPASGAAGIDRFGNAYTTRFATTYHWTVPPARAREAIRRALRVLAPLDVPDTSADQERAIVMREREQRYAPPGAKLGEAINAELYAGTPLARSVIGTPAEIETLTLEEACAFHERHYDPDDAVLVVAGAVDLIALTDALAAARAALGLPLVETGRVPGTAPGAEAPVTTGNAATADPNRPDIVDLPLVPRPPVRLRATGSFGAPERALDAVLVTDGTATSLAALDVIEAFLRSGLPGSPLVALEKGGERSGGRVPEAVADQVREVGFTLAEPARGLGYLGVTVGLRPTIEGERVGPSLDAAWEAWEGEWAHLRETGLAPDAFERLHARLVKDVARQRADGIDAAWSLIGWLEIGASPDEWSDYPTAVESLALNDVNAMLRHMGDPTRAVLTDVLPADGPTRIERRAAAPAAVTHDQDTPKKTTPSARP